MMTTTDASSCAKLAIPSSPVKNDAKQKARYRLPSVGLASAGGLGSHVRSLKP
jgi:hypothetical protein